MPILGIPDARPTRGVRIAQASRVLGILSLGLALIAFGLTAANAAAASQTDSQFTAVDGFIEAEMRALNIPGLALGIVHGDQIVHLRGFGIADPNGRAVSTQTPFVLGSTGKAFTAVAVMQLVEQGKIDLDAPVRRYLAWFQLTDGGASPPVTIRNLLHHTSGLSQASGRENLADGDDSTDALERNVRRLATARPTVSAGTEFRYSNANYDVLGLIVQTVAGQSFENYMRTQVFAPLAMQHSFMSASEAQRAGLATGYYPWFGVLAPTEMPYIPNGLPSGFMISSAEDMTHSLIAHLNGGRYRDVALLSSEGMLELHRPVASMGPWWDYAMGWSVHYLFDAQAADGTAGASGIPPPVVIDHDGEESTFRSYMALVPDGGWGVVALMNTNDLTVSSRFARVGAGVVPLLLERQPPPAVVYEDVLQRNVKLILASAALVQLLGLVLAVRTAKRWHRRPMSPAKRPLCLALRVGLPALAQLVLAGAVVILLPQRFEAPLTVLMRLVPDGGVLIATILSLALAGVGISAALVLSMLRQNADRYTSITASGLSNRA